MGNVEPAGQRQVPILEQVSDGGLEVDRLDGYVLDLVAEFAAVVPAFGQGVDRVDPQAEGDRERVQGVGGVQVRGDEEVPFRPFMHHVAAGEPGRAVELGLRHGDDHRPQADLSPFQEGDAGRVVVEGGRVVGLGGEGVRHPHGLGPLFVDLQPCSRRQGCRCHDRGADGGT